MDRRPFKGDHLVSNQSKDPHMLVICTNFFWLQMAQRREALERATEINSYIKGTEREKKYSFYLTLL